jgi:hypothetical protein
MSWTVEIRKAGEPLGGVIREDRPLFAAVAFFLESMIVILLLLPLSMNGNRWI